MTQKDYSDKITFVNVEAEKTTKRGNSLFTYNNKCTLRSEEVAIEYYKNKGYSAKHIENTVWQELFFDLIYYPLKKEYKKGSIKELNPNILDDEFYTNNKIIIESILKNLKEQDTIKLRDIKNYKILVLLKFIEIEQIAIIMEYLIKDYIHNRRGFPDLMVWNDEKLFFSEVKSHNDQLNRQQVAAHKILIKADINVEVFTINKTNSEISEVLSKYTTKFKPSRTQFKEKYNILIKKATNHFKLLDEEEQEKLFKYKEKNYDYYITILLILNDLHLTNSEEIKNNKKNILYKFIKTKEKVEFLRIMSEGKKYEDRHQYSEAIYIYKKLKNNPNKYRAYQRICMCYRKNKYYKKELDLINKVLEDETTPKEYKDIFERRKKRFINSKNLKN